MNRKTVCLNIVSQKRNPRTIWQQFQSTASLGSTAEPVPRNSLSLYRDWNESGMSSNGHGATTDDAGYIG